MGARHLKKQQEMCHGPLCRGERLGEEKRAFWRRWPPNRVLRDKKGKVYLSACPLSVMRDMLSGVRGDAGRGIKVQGRQGPLRHRCDVSGR